MGANVSVSEVVNKSIEDKSVNTGCSASGTSSNIIKNSTFGGSCPIEIKQISKSDASCTSSVNLKEILKKTDKMTKQQINAASLAVGVDNSKETNIEELKSKIEAKCTADTYSENIIEGLTYNQDCKWIMQTPNPEKLMKIYAENNKIIQNASSSVKCAVDLAQKIDKTVEKEKTQTQTGQSAILDTGSAASAVVGSVLGPLGIFGPLVIIVVLGVIGKMLMNGKNRNSFPLFPPKGMPSMIPKGMPPMMPKGIPKGIPKGMPPIMPKGIPKGIPKGMPPMMPKAMPKAVPTGLPVY